MIKKCISLLGALVVLQNVHAQFTFPVYEPFSEYPEGERLRTGASSGNYWNLGNSVSSTSSPIISQTNALSYPGLQPDPNNPAKGIFGATVAGRTAGATITSQTAGTVYLSFLFEPLTLPLADRPIIGLNGSTSTSPSPSSGPSVWISSTGQLKIDKSSSTAAFTNTTPALTLGSTYLVVMSYTIANGQVQLWVNPTSLGNNSSVPVATISSTNGANVTAIDSLCLYSGTGISISTNRFDELRVDNNWAGVTPASPSPGNVYNVTGGGSGCPGDAFAVGLNGSDSSSVVYLLYTNGSYSGQSVTGTGSAVTFGPQVVTATYSVLASNTVDSDVGWMNGSVTVSVEAGPAITAQPNSVTVATGGYTSFTVAASGSDLVYHWYKNGSPLSDGGDVSGSGTPTLTIYPAQASDAATAANGYYVVITNSCGLAATSSPVASLTLDTPNNLVWQGGNPNNVWDLGTTPNWFNSANAFTVFNAGDNVTFNDNSGNTTVTLVGNLAPTSVTEQAGQDYILSGSGSIVGPASLVMAGGGDLTISNVNTYTGGTTIESGDVIVDNSSQQCLGSGTVTLAGGMLEIGEASGAPNIGISNIVNVTANSTLQYDGTGTYALVMLNQLTGSPGATLTVNLNVAPAVAADRVRLYGTFTNNSPIAITSLGALVEWAPYNANGNQVYNGVISGNVGHILPRGAGTLILNGANTINDSFEAGNTGAPTGYGTILSGGTVGLGADSVSSSPPTIDSSPVGTGNLGIDVSVGNDNIFASGNAHTIANPLVYLSATNTVVLTVSGSYNLTLSGPITLSGADGTGGTNRTFNITNSALTMFSGSIGDAGLDCGLIKNGGSTLVLGAINTYDGPTIVSNGTLLVNGQIDTNVTSVVGGTLGGSGTILGPVAIQSGARLAPGTSAIGTLTINNNLTIGGNALFKLNESLSTSNDMVVVTGTLNNTGTGTLTVTNLGPALAAGDTFTLFSQPVANGNTLTVTGAGVTWTNHLAVDGGISVLPPTSTLPNTPTNISFSVSAGSFTITWPGSYLGWELEAQTNALNVSLSTNSSAWFVVAGSTTTTNESFTINPASPSVYYRLAHP